MMINEYGPRRGYDDRWDGRWDGVDYWGRQGRSLDPRYEARRYNGDWMREWPWMREPAWVHEPAAWAREPSWQRAPDLYGYEPMTKVIELFAESPYSWEDATRRAVAEASQTVRGIRSIHLKDMQALVEDDRVVGFRIHAKISFTPEEGRRRR